MAEMTVNKKLVVSLDEEALAAIRNLTQKISSAFGSATDSSDSNLVKHAERELKLIGEDQDVIEGYIRVIQAFADMGHSGGSASVAIPIIERLLRFQPLTDLTDDPDEWFRHGPDGYPSTEDVFWQNKRNGEAFSYDGGKTYYLLSEGGNAMNPEPKHKSKSHLEG